MTYLRRKKTHFRLQFSKWWGGTIARAIPAPQAASQPPGHVAKAVSAQLVLNFACLAAFSQPCCEQKGRCGGSSFSFSARRTKPAPQRPPPPTQQRPTRRGRASNSLIPSRQNQPFSAAKPDRDFSR